MDSGKYVRCRKITVRVYVKKTLMSKFKPIIRQSEAKDYWWCSCGKSNNQPFCDGSHKGTE